MGDCQAQLLTVHGLECIGCACLKLTMTHQCTWGYACADAPCLRFRHLTVVVTADNCSIFLISVGVVLN